MLASSYSRNAEVKGGGVGIWIKKGLKYNNNINLKPFCIDKHSEFCYCSLQDKYDKNFIVLNCYRSPSGDLDIFLDNLDCVLNRIYKPNAYIAVCGDFNVNSGVRNNDHTKLLNVLSSYNVINNLIKWPTRVSRDSATTIDNIFVNFSNRGLSCVFDNTVSDHRTVLVEVDCDVAALPKFYRARNFTDSSITDFIRGFMTEDWNELYGILDTNLAFTNFINIFTFYFNVHFPLITRQSVKRNTKWINNDVRRSSTNLKNLHALSRTFPELRDYYKDQKKDHLNLLKATRKKHYQNVIEKSDNPTKSAWKVINDFTNNNNIEKQSISLLSNENELLENPVDVANSFNSFFRNAPLDIIKNIPCGSASESVNDPAYASQKTFLLYPYTQMELYELLQNKLKNKSSYGFDDIPAFLLKKVVFFIISPLTYLVNLSFSNGNFPDCLKTGRVVPILKRGDPKQVGNYRPITIPSIFSKIFEYAYLERMNFHLKQNHILIKNQHGFQANKSTNSAVHSFYENLTHLVDAGECPVGIFCDLSRAFDCVNHKILINKLINIGVQGHALEWIKSYLNTRCQYVSLPEVTKQSVTDCKSDYLDISVGVPQGSIVGPVLFLIYVNDIVRASPSIHFTLYADDTSILISDKSNNSLEEKCNGLLSSLYDWFCMNSLHLNAEKTLSIHFHNRQKQVPPIHVNINNKVIENVSCVKFLGLYIDECLDWKRHCETVISKLNSVSYLFRNMRSVLTEKQLIMLYFAQAESRLRYGICFWGSSTCFNDVFISQKKIIRCIAGVSRTTSCRNFF